MPSGLAPVAELAHGVGLRVVVGDDGAALAAGAEILAGVEAEAGQVAEGAGAPALVLGAVSLGRVLDEGEPVLIGEGADRIHVRHEAVEVHRQDGLRALGERALEPLGVHGPRALGDVDEHGPRADVAHRRRGGDEGHGHGDDLVVRLDAGGHERHLQRARARAHGDAVLRAAEGGELALERLHLGAEDVLGAREHPLHRWLHLVADAAVLGLKIQIGNHLALSLEGSSTWRPRSRMEAVAASSISTTRRPISPPVFTGVPFSIQSTK